MTLRQKFRTALFALMSILLALSIQFAAVQNEQKMYTGEAVVVHIEHENSSGTAPASIRVCPTDHRETPCFWTTSNITPAPKLGQTVIVVNGHAQQPKEVDAP